MCCRCDRIIWVIGVSRAEEVVGWFVIGQYLWVLRPMVVPFVMLSIVASGWGVFWWLGAGLQVTAVGKLQGGE